MPSQLWPNQNTSATHFWVAINQFQKCCSTQFIGQLLLPLLRLEQKIDMMRNLWHAFVLFILLFSIFKRKLLIKFLHMILN